MEKTTAKTKRISACQAFKEILRRLWGVIRAAAVNVGRMSFWRMAFLCCALRLFVVYPLGAGAAISAGCVWLYWNVGFVKTALLNGLWGLLKMLGGYEQRSIWFEHEGREKIRAVISRLSAQGVNYCDLVEQIEDLPPENQWYAICSGLNDMGIIAQASRRSLYITWRLPQTAAE